MKASEIRDLSLDEMKAKVVEMKEGYFNLRFQHGAGQLENTAKLKQARNDLARLETIIVQTENKEKTEKD